MPLAAASFPLATPLDPAEEPPGSIDPLGTLAHAERLAELILPGLTVRMWRARLLTLAALAAAVADRALRHLGGREETRLEARLTFERFVVSAIVRAAQKNPEEYRPARRRLPGSDLARAALAAGDPLTRHNFLKGEAINGPYGVIARLALQLRLTDGDGRPGQNGPALLLAWADDLGLPGVLDEDDEARRPGAAWTEDVARQVARWVKHRDWPGPQAGIWQRLADALRLDRLGAGERRILVRLLEQDPARGRVLGILRERVEVYRQHTPGDRGVVERGVLLQAVRPALGDGPVDRVLRAACFVAHVYEAASVWLQQGFDAVLWGLKQLGGRAAPTDLLGQAAVRDSLGSARNGLQAGLLPLDAAVAQLQERTEVSRPELIEPVVRLREDVASGTASPAAFLDMLTRRHERVQREKRKGAWIDRETRWTLLPGFGVGGEQPPKYGSTYLHPFRIVNAYALLADTGSVNLEDPDAEE